MNLSDYDSVDIEHWSSRAQVDEFIDRSGIASMLAFDGQQLVGQLYLQEYDPSFSEPSTGERSWASYPPLPWRASLLGRGIGTTLLRAVIDWFNQQSRSMASFRGP